MGFQQGLSGLNATSKNLEVIGNNIANANTFGAKASRAEFSDMYAAALNGAGADNVGIGTHMVGVAQQFTQGNIVASENPMDLAINGAGFFQLTDGKSPPMYSRNGQFKVDSAGYIVSGAGLKLMGYGADGAGVVQPGLALPLKLPSAGIKPNPTANMLMELNVDARKSISKPAAGGIVLTDPKTYNDATSATAYDAKGQPVALTYYFQKTDNNNWDVYLTANGALVDGAAGAGSPVTSLVFPDNGGNPTSPTTKISINIPASVNSSGALTVAIPNLQLDILGATQYGANFGVTNLTQDGYAPGQLSGVNIEANGIVMARYSNGQTKPAGQLEIATFRNPQGLQPLGGNNWTRTYTSGDPIVGVPGNGNLGTLQSGSLEESNVDLTGELVNMMTAQREYQANAQTIKTEDQVLQTLVNMR